MTVTTIHPAPAADTADTAHGGTNAATAAPGRGGAAGAVWDALTANPGATAMTIAKAAGVSRTTAAKALTAMEAAAEVVRTPGTGSGPGRMADTWTAVTAAEDTAEGVAVGGEGDAPQSPSADTGTATDGTGTATDAGDPPSADTAPGDDGVPDADGGSGAVLDLREAMRILEAESDTRAANSAELARIQAEEEARRAKIDAELRRALVKEETRGALADLLATVTATYAAVIADDEAAVTAGLEKIGNEAAAVRRAAKAPARTGMPNGSYRNGGQRTGGGDRNAPRPLKPSVAAHLTGHPGKEFTANEIAKVLDRSAGAVANALDSLTRDGVAELTCEHPRRFRAIDTGDTAPAAADTGTGAVTADGGTGAATRD